MISRQFIFCLLAQIGTLAIAFPRSSSITWRPINLVSEVHLLKLRGGQQGQERGEEIEELNLIADRTKFSFTAPTAVLSFGKLYTDALVHSPVLTKSATAGFIFGLSDWMAQKLERGQDGKALPYNTKRTISATLVGFLYFGPAAHYWYEWIFRILPGTSFSSTMQKAALGQLLFGPSFTCIFFAAALMQSGSFSLGSWLQKIRQDLLGAWLAGVGYWPLVDLISFSIVPKQWIPLFVNFASLVWNIYLSLVANRERVKQRD